VAARNNFMCLQNFLLIFSPLVDLALLHVLDVMLSVIPLEISSLELDDRSDRYLFGCTYTPLSEKETLVQRVAYKSIDKDKHLRDEHITFGEDLCWMFMGQL